MKDFTVMQSLQTDGFGAQNHDRYFLATKSLTLSVTEYGIGVALVSSFFLNRANIASMQTAEPFPPLEP